MVERKTARRLFSDLYIDGTPRCDHNATWKCSADIKIDLPIKQCLRYKILPSGLCAETCCNRGKKGLLGRIRTFSGPILEQIRTFYHYVHQNAELLKIMRKHDNPISRREKVH